MAEEREEESLYCVCRRPYQEEEFMIECDVCNDWFHGRSADILISAHRLLANLVPSNRHFFFTR